MRKLLGPLIVITGLAVGALGIWWMKHARPTPGAFVDAIAVEPGAFVAIRQEAHSNNNFVEIHQNDRLQWRALVPTYAGKLGAPAIGLGSETITVRFVRGGHSEIFGLTIKDARKLGSQGMVKARPASPTGHCGAVVTLTDRRNAYEVMVGDTWNELAAIEVNSGALRWTAKVPSGVISAGYVAEEGVWLTINGKLTGFRTSDGARLSDTLPIPSPTVRPEHLTVDRARGIARIERAGQIVEVPWPADAFAPQTYHLIGDMLLQISPQKVTWVALNPIAAR